MVTEEEKHKIIIKALIGKRTIEALDPGACSECGQSVYMSGEYPCKKCGRPLVWDEPYDKTV